MNFEKEESDVTYEFDTYDDNKKENDKKLLSHNEICEVIEEYIDDFDYQIKKRGEKYYEDGHIVSIIRDGNTFISKIDGTERYSVEINFDDEGAFVDYSCNCPYDFPCKHEYAILLAIKNHEYEEMKLKPFVKKNEYSLKKLVEIIPSEELKEYILSEKDKNFIIINVEHFENYFAKYMPRQTYDYYYNNLFNSIVLDGYNEIKYVNIARGLINDGEYQEAFYAIKAVIEVANNLHLINKWEELIDKLPSILMMLRIIYRKADINVKLSIEEWMNDLKERNYYNSLYLEDVIITVKDEKKDY